MSRVPLQRYIGHLMYTKGLTRQQAVLKATIARRNNWIPKKFEEALHADAKVTEKIKKVRKAVSKKQQSQQLELFPEKIAMNKIAKPKVKQTRETGEDTVLDETRKTTYHRGDTSADKKKIVNQIANQVTVNPHKTKQILKDWENSTVVADTTFNYGGSIKEVDHSLKRHSYVLPSLEVSATRKSDGTIRNRYGDDVRIDYNPTLPKGQTMFQPEGLKKKELIKVNSLKVAKKIPFNKDAYKNLVKYIEKKYGPIPKGSTYKGPGVIKKHAETTDTTKAKPIPKSAINYDVFLAKHKSNIDAALEGTTDPTKRQELINIWQRDSTNVVQAYDRERKNVRKERPSFWKNLFGRKQ